jgi:hypothetical protein
VRDVQRLVVERGQAERQQRLRVVEQRHPLAPHLCRSAYAGTCRHGLYHARDATSGSDAFPIRADCDAAEHCGTLAGFSDRPSPARSRRR